MQARLVVVNEHRRSDVHRIDQNQAILYATFSNQLLDLVVNGDDFAPLRHIHPQLFCEGLHLESC